MATSTGPKPVVSKVITLSNGANAGLEYVMIGRVVIFSSVSSSRVYDWVNNINITQTPLPKPMADYYFKAQTADDDFLIRISSEDGHMKNVSGKTISKTSIVSFSGSYRS